MLLFFDDASFESFAVEVSLAEEFELASVGLVFTYGVDLELSLLADLVLSVDLVDSPDLVFVDELAYFLVSVDLDDDLVLSFAVESDFVVLEAGSTFLFVVDLGTIVIS